MKTGFDLASLYLSNAGERRYTSGLLSALLDQPAVSVQPVAPMRRRPGTSGQTWALRGLWQGLFHPILLRNRAAREQLALIHYPRPLLPLRQAGLPPAVVTVHDTLALERPELFTAGIRAHQRLMLRRTASHAARLITGSQHAGNRIAETLEIDPARIAVTPYGVEDRFSPEDPDLEALAAQLGIHTPYLLCVGTIEPRKNLATVLDAFRLLRAQRPELTLVVAGPPGWRSESLLARMRQQAGVTHLGLVADEQLVSLYRGAACLVFAPLAEGFGFPALEALACGTPVVASDTGSLVEVVGDAALLVDPHEPEAIASAVSRILDSPGLARELRDRGAGQASRFTWKACAEATIAVYREVLSERG